MVIIPIILHIATQPPEEEIKHDRDAANDEENALVWMGGDIKLDSGQFMIEPLSRYGVSRRLGHVRNKRNIPELTSLWRSASACNAACQQ